MRIKPLIELVEEYPPEDVAYSLYKIYLESDEKFNSFITLRKWEDVEREVKRSKGPLKGIIIPVKDNISTKGILTTCASRILSNYIPPYDATVIEIIKKNGGVIAGKTNMDEFAMGNTNENSYFGPVYNPWNKDHVPGGSSGGSAVTVSYNGYIALGSDTGGSIRQPASYNYVLGLKPTYGSVSRYGLISYGESLEQIGPLSRFPEDLAYFTYLITEKDYRDVTMPDTPKRDEMRRKLLEFIKGNYEVDPKKMKIGYSSQIVELADAKVGEKFYEVLDYLLGLGIDIVDINMDFLKVSLPVYYIIAMVEASSNLARYDGSNYGLREEATDYWVSAAKTRVDGFGIEVKRRIIMGALASSKGYENKYYIKALQLRRYLRDQMLELLSIYDFILTPTTPTPPPKFGEALGPKGYALDLYTVTPNLTGLPALNIPISLIDGLPIGIQVIGSYFSEGELIAFSKLLEGKIYDPYKTPRGDD